LETSSRLSRPSTFANHQHIMTTKIPRTACTLLSGYFANPILNLPRSGATRSTCLRAVKPARQTISRPFSSTCRYAATPATSYAPKSNDASKSPAPRPSNSKSNAIDDQSPIKDISTGLADEPIILDEGSRQVDWTRSFHGLSAQPFSKEAAEILMAPIPFDDVEVKPDGILYLPEIKYRRILNKAFGPGAWGLAPRGETIVTSKSITREYALVAHGRSESSQIFSVWGRMLISFVLAD
jgi:hypothetical protein